jgi:site-specific DNA recombinase
MKYFAYCRRSSEAEDRQVMSIESQRGELRRLFGAMPNVAIVDWCTESKSAKSPGRPLFDQLISRIERGEASGIVAWAPDRLARNSIDGGRLIYLLDTGKLMDLKFATYTFENNSQGKFMLQIMFGQSKYYSDALSENVKRGNRTKVENGWRPNQAPLGYLNDSTTKTIINDPVHFPLIRKMYELMLTGKYSTRQVARIAREDWGFRTPKRRRIGGVPLSLSSTHKILTNPFYAGLIYWGGHVYQGKHKPVVSIDEFEHVGKFIRKPSSQLARKHTFAFTGLIRCGNCGLRVTAEHKINRHGSRYVYYHCTKRRLAETCKEPSVEVAALESQVLDFLNGISIDRRVHDWLMTELQHEDAKLLDTNEAVRQSLAMAQSDVAKQLDELTGLRIRSLIDDSEYMAQRHVLETERLRLGQKLAEADSSGSMFEPLREIISFSSRAVEWFEHGDMTTKRLILDTVGSNPLLKDKMLLIEAIKPFSAVRQTSTCPEWLATGHAIRTPQSNTMSQIEKLKKAAKDEPHLEKIISNIKKIKTRVAMNQGA